MIKSLKKLVTAYQAKRLANRRKAENRRQSKLIYEGLIERGF